MERKYYPDPGVAAVLSFLFTGLGQLYNGQIGKGLVLMSISAVSVFFLILGTLIVVNSFLCKVDIFPNSSLLGFILLVASIVVITINGICNIYDAYNTAIKKI